MDKERIINGIKAYGHEQKVILRALRMKGGMGQDEFDIFFGDEKCVTGSDGVIIRSHKLSKKLRFYGDTFLNSNAFLLGDMFRLGDWSKWLELTQFMVAIGLVNAIPKDGRVYYYGNREIKDTWS